AGLLGVVAAGEGRPGVAGDLHDDEGGREQHDAGMGLDRVVDLVADLVGDGARDGEAGDEGQPELRLPLAAGSGRVAVGAAWRSAAGTVPATGRRAWRSSRSCASHWPQGGGGSTWWPRSSPSPGRSASVELGGSMARSPMRMNFSTRMIR